MTTKTFMCILRSEQGGCKQPSSPTEMEEMFAKYQAWQQKFSANIKDMGGKLGSEGSVVRQDDVKDGPFIELKEIIGGYMLLSADNLEEATAVIAASPMIENSQVSIEIREISQS